MRLTTAQLTTIRQLIRQGLSDIKIADKVHTSRQTVYNIRTHKTHKDGQ